MSDKYIFNLKHSVEIRRKIRNITQSPPLLR